MFSKAAMRSYTRALHVIIDFSEHPFLLDKLLYTFPPLWLCSASFSLVTFSQLSTLVSKHTVLSPLGILANYVTMSGLSVHGYRKQLKLVWQEFKLILTRVHNTGIYIPVWTSRTSVSPPPPQYQHHCALSCLYIQSQNSAHSKPPTTYLRRCRSNFL